jgi:hypothetical protein
VRDRLQAAAVQTSLFCCVCDKKSGNVGVTSVEACIQLIYFTITLGGFSAYTR